MECGLLKPMNFLVLLPNAQHFLHANGKFDAAYRRRRGGGRRRRRLKGGHLRVVVAWQKAFGLAFEIVELLQPRLFRARPAALSPWATRAWVSQSVGKI